MNNPNVSRMGAGSPSYDSASKLYSRRAREIQAEEGVAPPPWRLSAAASQSSLREQSALHEGSTADFPSTIGASPGLRRARAGTLPSKFIPNLSSPSPPSNLFSSSSSSRISPVPSPFAPMNTQQPIERKEMLPPVSASIAAEASVTSRLRSGSLGGMPSRPNYAGTNNGFPSSLSLWSNNRAANSSNLPASPASGHSSFSREDDASASMRTLDYLGLADTPQPAKATLVGSQGIDSAMEGARAAAMQPFIADMATFQRNINRMRSYSVNAKEHYDDEEDDDIHYGLPSDSGSLTPGVTMHSQLFGNITARRPRASTAGILEQPSIGRMKNYASTPSRLADSSISASDINGDYFELSDQMNNLSVQGGHGIPRTASGDGGLQAIDENAAHEGPTRSLWLGNIPPSTTVSTLVQIFQQYGPVESARVLTHKSCGFVNFVRIESAMQARAVLNGKEIFPGAGAVRIGFAKVLSETGNGSPNGANRSMENLNHGAEDSGSLNGNGSADQSVNAAPELDVPSLPIIKDEILKIVEEFSTDDEARGKIAKCIDNAINYQDYEQEIPAVPDPSHNRVHDAPKLRDIRKRIDNNACSKQEIEDIAIAMLDEVAELSSDYLGNTVVQKLFEFCSEDVKERMLERVAPHLAEIGIHKNGTWAGQKIIDVARTPTQMELIVKHLRKYTVALFHDQYGNYVLQCCLRFGSPWNDFVFEAMMARMWEIAQGRFGARAMRACLESHHATKEQQKMLAACIALHSVQLASNANGALLLTWFLDTCSFVRRKTVLAPRLVPNLVHLCTHKVAYLTVLKVINQRSEPEARDIIMKALFFSENDRVLEEILRDHSCGATLIFKVLTTPFFDEAMRKDVSENIRNVLTRIKAQASQGYKRLMDEVGMSTRNTGSQSSHS
ncbi:ARM repeat-containing protein, partial [Ascobolus immersus RN42]